MIRNVGQNNLILNLEPNTQTSNPSEWANREQPTASSHVTTLFRNMKSFLILK